MRVNSSVSGLPFWSAFEEPSGDPNTDLAGKTMTFTREEPDQELCYLSQSTKTVTETREENDQDPIGNMRTIPLAVASKTQTMTMTKTREEQDQDAPSNGMSAIPRPISVHSQTQTRQREEPDQDESVKHLSSIPHHAGTFNG